MHKRELPIQLWLDLYSIFVNGSSVKLFLANQQGLSWYTDLSEDH